MPKVNFSNKINAYETKRDWGVRASLGHESVSFAGNPDLVEPLFGFESDERAVVVVDLVDSVRLMELDERHTVSQWLELRSRIENQILPEFQGRLINSTGDGIVIEHQLVRDAIAATFKIHETCSDLANLSPDKTKALVLRIGIDFSSVYRDHRDIYGRGVNRAARLASLGQPGDTIISSHAKDQLTTDLDADIEDLGNFSIEDAGDCFVKSLDGPQRCFRARSPNSVQQHDHLALNTLDLFPTVAVLPFEVLSPDRAEGFVGDIVAEEIIRTMSCSPFMKMISRLSTSAFRNSNVDFDQVSSLLGADFLLSGRCKVFGERLHLSVELAEVRTKLVVWSNSYDTNLREVLSKDRGAVTEIAEQATNAIAAKQLAEAKHSSIRNLRTYSLMMAAITLTHRMSRDDYVKAGEFLEAAIQREPRQALPYAWMANWHVLGAMQGWAVEPEMAGRSAINCSRRALDANPDDTLALTMDGLVHTNLLKDLDTGQKQYDRALEVNPNNSLAWLLSGTLHAFKGDGERALEPVNRALSLSPLDPHKYYYDSLAATANFVAGDLEKARKLCKRSLRANATHTSTLRVFAATLWKLGLRAEAKDAALKLRELEPDLTVSGWLQNSPAAEYQLGKEFAGILQKVGIPE